MSFYANDEKKKKKKDNSENINAPAFKEHLPLYYSRNYTP